MSEKDITRFIIFTRGRTGSTAIVDELHSMENVTCWQELFIPLARDPMLLDLYNKHGTNFDEYDIGRWMPTYELWLKQFRQVKFLWKTIYLDKNKLLTEKTRLKMYLDEMEAREIKEGRKAVGFKMLQHQAKSSSTFMKVLKELGYKVIYLERKNVIRQVLSGVIANARKVYNERNYTPGKETHVVNLKQFRFLVKSELIEVENQKELINKYGFETITVSYEDFLDNREIFYKNVCDFLDIDFVVPDGSSFSIMISDVKDVVRNYPEFAVCVQNLGMSEYL